MPWPLPRDSDERLPICTLCLSLLLLEGVLLLAIVLLLVSEEVAFVSEVVEEETLSGARSKTNEQLLDCDVFFKML